jgi:hypothetical protein
VTVDKLAPFDATLSLSSTTLSGTATSTTLTIDSPRTTAAGTYSLRLRFTSGSLVHEQLVSVTVEQALNHLFWSPAGNAALQISFPIRDHIDIPTLGQHRHAALPLGNFVHGRGEDG